MIRFCFILWLIIGIGADSYAQEASPLLGEGSALPPATDEDLVVDEELASDEKPAIDELTLLLAQDPLPQAKKSVVSTDITLLRNNLHTTWLRLAASGKNQVEIEAYLSQVPHELIVAVKDQIRRLVVFNLKGRLQNLEKSYDSQMLVQLKKIITAEISYYGLELDQRLAQKIKEELGFSI